MKKILIPTDFSDNAYHALCYAVYLFEKEQCNFFILNAYQTGPSNLESLRNKNRDTRLFQIARQASKNGLLSVLEKIKTENSNLNHTFKTMDVSDPLLNAIGRSVIDHNIDYIFMGTQGATGLKGVFLGSNTLKVIGKIDYCPIVAVPSNYSFEVPREILFATGFEHLYNKYELNPMVYIAKLWDSKIRVMHVVNREKYPVHKETAKKVVADRLYQISYEIMEIEKKDKVSVEIEKVVANNKDIGMVAMINYWHGFIEKLTSEPVIKKVAFSTKVPFLVMHLPE